MATAQFPWDSLKAESLRSLCRDLGGLQGRRDEMITFLKAVEERGLEAALQLEVRPAPEPKPAKVVVTSDTPSLKRPRQAVVSDYNTRHRGKRVRVSDPGPGARRKAVRKTNGPSEANVYSPKPPKSKAAPTTGTPSKGRRTIFDGVVLPRFFPSADKGKDKADAVMSNGAPSVEKGEDGEGEEEAASEGADQVLEGLEDSREESSLANSNKENEGILPGQSSGDDDEPAAPGDAASSPPSQRVLENIVEVAAQTADEDMDAEGEMVAEHEHEHQPEIVVRPNAPLAVHAESAQPSPEDLSHVEQTVQLTVENGHTL